MNIVLHCVKAEYCKNKSDNILEAVQDGNIVPVKD